MSWTGRENRLPASGSFSPAMVPGPPPPRRTLRAISSWVVFATGTVFLFARHEGFRFHGQMIGKDTREIEVVLSRNTEPPPRVMTTLPDPIPLEESRALALKVIGPYLDAVLARGDDSAKMMALYVAASRRSRRNTGTTGIGQVPERDGARQGAGPDRRGAGGERSRGGGGRGRVDLLARKPRASAHRGGGRLAGDAIARASLPCSTGPCSRRGPRTGWWIACTRCARSPSGGPTWASTTGRNRCSKECRELGEQMTGVVDPMRVYFSIRLARVDLPAALEHVAKIRSKEQAREALDNIAGNLAATSPAECERVLGMIDSGIERSVALDARLPAHGAGRSSPGSAAGGDGPGRRVPRESPDVSGPRSEGAGPRTRRWRRFAKGFACSIGWPSQAATSCGSGKSPAFSLVAEQIDPSLVPEIFWRALAARSPSGDPRQENDGALTVTAHVPGPLRPRGRPRPFSRRPRPGSSR